MFSGYVYPLLAACALPLLAPVQGSGRDYCRSPLPCTGARRGNPPGPPARGQRGRRATSRIASARPAPSLPPRSRPAPQGASHFAASVTPVAGLTARLRFAFNPARGFFGGNTPARPAAFGRSRPPPEGAPLFDIILDMVDIPLILH